MKRYLTTYLPGDVMLANDGSIGLIIEASIRLKDGRRLNWNDRLKPSEEIDAESYSVDAIPGYQLTKNAWWDLSELVEVLKGPLHQVLVGERRFKSESAALLK